MKLLIGLAELRLLTGAYAQALQEVDQGLQDALVTSSRRYVAKGWAVRGKIVAQLGDRETAGADLQRAYTLAEQVRSPTLLYPIATELGQWYETVGREQEARACYTKAKATIEQIINALEDQNLRAIFLQSALVQAVTTHVLSGTDKEGDRSHGQHKAEPDCVSIAPTARRIGRDSSRSENRG